MADSEVVARLSAALVARAGGYLRNTVRQEKVTCAVCATPVAGFELCYQCIRHPGRAGLPDAVAFLTYAVAGRQSGYLMQGYKARPPVPEHHTIVSLLVLLALARHAGCADRAGPSAPVPVTHWSTVPSLPAQPGEHPLHAIVSRLAPGRESVLVAADEVEYPRGVAPRHFRTAPLPRGAHVLLVDDTWARGGHARSAVLALRAAGAARVSVLVAARWINEDFGGNAAFLRGLVDRDYDPAICPWTGGGCPPPLNDRAGSDSLGPDQQP
jgi:predicted amidophosphoribosyltransferase